MLRRVPSHYIPLLPALCWGLVSCLIYNEDLLVEDDGQGGATATSSSSDTSTSSAGGMATTSTSSSSSTTTSSSSSTSGGGGTGGSAPVVLWINEIHYEDEGGDGDEGVEIAGTAGTNLSGYQLVGINGATLSDYDTISLSGVIPNQQAGLGTIWFPFAGLQNGGTSPDGIALVDPNAAIVQFLSYEGSFTPSSGVAQGMASVDIGQTESDTTTDGTSLQLQGTGASAADFTWAPSATSTHNALNNGQTFQ